MKKRNIKKGIWNRIKVHENKKTGTTPILFALQLIRLSYDVAIKYLFSYSQIADEVLAMSISLTPEEILELAMKINQTIQGLQNIEGILEDTRDNLTLAQQLKERADNAS